MLILTDRERQARTRRNKKTAAATVIAGILFGVYCLKLSEPFSVFFAKALSRPLRTAAGFLTSLVPFSVTEFAIVVAVVFGVVFLVKIFAALCTRRFFKFFDRITSLILIVVTVGTLYAVTAQFDYERPAPDKPWLTADLGVEEYRALALRCAEDAARLAASFPKDAEGYTVAPSFEESAKKMQKEVQKYAGGDYGFYVPLPKKVFNSWEMVLTGVLGLTFAPLNEVNMNANISGLDAPYYMAHELAHSLGVMTEREANIFAAFATLCSDEPYIRYSGYRALWYDLIEPFTLLDRSDKNYIDRAKVASERFGVAFPNDAIQSSGEHEYEIVDEVKWAEFVENLKKTGGFDAISLLNGWGETETAYRKTLSGDFAKDYRIPYYSENLPDWMSGIKGFFNKVGQWFNDLYLKQSGIGDGTGNYNTGDSALLPPEQNADGTWESQRIDYSETLKIIIWHDGFNRDSEA